MTTIRHCFRLATCLVACSYAFAGQPKHQIKQQPVRHQAVQRPHTIRQQSVPSLLARLITIPPFVIPLTAGISNCAIGILSPVEDPQAAAFESTTDTEAMIDTSGLTQATASALSRLQELVASIGGRLELKSAFRPVAYQEHLQEVWDKWRLLRRNRQSSCAALRETIQAEFARHRLLPTQRPVTNSDHTRGVGIDAALILPPKARLNRRRITLDKLARMVGFGRPDIRHDPVHFRLLASTETSSVTATN